MKTGGNTDANRQAANLEALRLRALVYDLSREHADLRPLLLRLGAAGGALAANPANMATRREAQDAWQAMHHLVEHHMADRDDEALLENAEDMKVVPDAVAEAMLGACRELKKLEHDIAKVDFDNSLDPVLADAGVAMRKFAVTLDDLAIGEDRQVLRPLRRVLYHHCDAIK